MGKKAIAFSLLLAILVSGIVFALSSRKLVVRGKSGILFESRDNLLFVYFRDNQGKFHLRRFNLSDLSAKPSDFVLDSFPSIISLSPQGERAFWFTPYGGEFHTLSLSTGEQNTIQQKKPGEKSFWMDPPYQVYFSSHSVVQFFGYAMSEDGTGGPDGIIQFNLEKKGLSAFQLLVTEEELVKSASPVKGPLAVLFPSFEQVLFYGLKDASGIHLFKYDLNARAASKIDDFQAMLGKGRISSDGQWMVYQVLSNRKTTDIVLYSLADGKKTIIASGPYLLLDINKDGSSILVARNESTTTTVGPCMKSSGFKYHPFAQMAHSVELRGRFAEVNKGLSVLLSTDKGIELFGP